MLSSADPSNQGPSGFELLFYEASHAISGSVEDAIVRECHAVSYTHLDVYKRQVYEPGDK